MPTPKKTKSGKWNARVFIGRNEDGKPVYKCITTETKAECIYQIGVARATPYVPKPPKGAVITVSDAITKYIELSQVLSPTTLHAYDRIQQYAFPSIMHSPVENLDDITMQEAINAEVSRPNGRTGKPLSAKTIKNEWGLVAAALRTVCKRTFDVKLPRTAQKVETLPEVSQIMNVVKGSPVELPCLLAMCMSLTASEIRGIRCSSIRNGYIFIDQVRVTVAGESIVKETGKTDSRLRRLKIPDFMIPIIEKAQSYQEYKKTHVDGYLVPYPQYYIYNTFTRRAKAAGLNLSFHDLRHVFASVMLTELNIPEKIVQKEGGWKTPHVMKSVYSQTFSSSQERADARRDEYFSEMYGVQNNAPTR